MSVFFQSRDLNEVISKTCWELYDVTDYVSAGTAPNWEELDKRESSAFFETGSQYLFAPQREERKTLLGVVQFYRM